jgi:hypothetical protein
MDHLRLLLPDLFLPPGSVPDNLPGVSVLETMLARARPVPLSVTDHEARLCELLGAGAAAPLRAAGDGLESGSGYWMCADPVALQRQPAQVMLQPGLPCELSQAQAFCDALNGHFASDGLRFHAPHPQRWYLRCAAPFAVQMPTLGEVAWQDVRRQLPQGPDALRWQALGNEIQMLLHGHPLNQARLVAGLPAIDSLWLWGGGQAEAAHVGVQAVGGDEPLAVLARGAGLPVYGDIRSLLESDVREGLWLAHGLRDTLAQRGLNAWHDTLQDLQDTVLLPLWQALGEWRLHALTLECAAGGAVRGFELTPSTRWRFWRRRRPLAAYSV